MLRYRLLLVLTITALSCRSTVPSEGAQASSTGAPPGSAIETSATTRTHGQNSRSAGQDPAAMAKPVERSAANAGPPEAPAPGTHRKETQPALDAFALAYKSEIEKKLKRPVRLTLDAPLQLAVRKAVEATKKIAGAVVVSVATGAILAAYATPNRDGSDPLREALVPGCTFKGVLGVIALSEGAIDKSSEHVCTGSFKAQGHTFRDFNSHGPLNVQKALATSCDNFFQAAGVELDLDTFNHHAATYFGIGEPTGLEFTDSATGLGTLPDAAWYKAQQRSPSVKDTLDVMTGHGDLRATPFQLARAYAALASGSLKPLHLVEGTAGRPAPNAGLRLPYSTEHLETIREGLSFTVSKKFGTAKNARIKELSFAGKTGSVREKGQVLGLFAAFAPVATPEIALVTLVRGPRRATFGAVPLAQEVLMGWLNTQKAP